MNVDNLPFRARRVLDLSTTEAGQLVHVTRRTWELWESGKISMPLAKLELFIAKLQGLRSELRELLVVIGDDGVTPVDVVASDGFCSLAQNADGSYVISSLAVDRATGRPYVHRQRFLSEHNAHAIKKASTWKSVTETIAR